MNTQHTETHRSSTFRNVFLGLLVGMTIGLCMVAYQAVAGTADIIVAVF